MITEDELRKAFERAKQHAIEVYPLYDKMINYILLKISNNSHKKTVLAEADYDRYLIIAHISAINQHDYNEESMYYVFLHEFAHILQERVDRHAPSHGSIFKTIAHNLGLENPAPVTMPLGHTMYSISVPEKTTNGKIVKKHYYVMQEWLDKHPNFKKYVVKSYNHP